MTSLSAETTDAIVSLEQMVVEWLLRSVPVGVLVLIAVVGLAVSWLSWTERRSHATPSHAGPGR